MDTTAHTRTLKMNTVQDTITCWLSIVTGSCGRVHSRKTHSYINSPINVRCGHTVVTLKLFLTVRSRLRSERCLLTIPDKSKNSNSHNTAVVKICSIKGKPKLQEQESEKHTCTSSQTHTTSTHGYCGLISCTQHHKSHTNISDNGTQPLKGKWIGL